jgi:hypothetical protein
MNGLPKRGLVLLNRVQRAQAPRPVFGITRVPPTLPRLFSAGPEHGIRARRTFRADYLPANSGSRFSRKARVPSAKSSLAASAS